MYEMWVLLTGILSAQRISAHHYKDIRKIRSKDKDANLKDKDPQRAVSKTKISKTNHELQKPQKLRLQAGMKVRISQSFADVTITDAGTSREEFLLASDGLVAIFARGWSLQADIKRNIPGVRELYDSAPSDPATLGSHHADRAKLRDAPPPHLRCPLSHHHGVRDSGCPTPRPFFRAHFAARTESQGRDAEKFEAELKRWLAGLDGTVQLMKGFLVDGGYGWERLARTDQLKREINRSLNHCSLPTTTIARLPPPACLSPHPLPLPSTPLLEARHMASTSPTAASRTRAILLFRALSARRIWICGFPNSDAAEPRLRLAHHHHTVLSRRRPPSCRPVHAPLASRLRAAPRVARVLFHSPDGNGRELGGFVKITAISIIGLEGNTGQLWYTPFLFDVYLLRLIDVRNTASTDCRQFGALPQLSALEWNAESPASQKLSGLGQLCGLESRRHMSELGLISSNVPQDTITSLRLSSARKGTWALVTIGTLRRQTNRRQFGASRAPDSRSVNIYMREGLDFLPDPAINIPQKLALTIFVYLGQLHSRSLWRLEKSTDHGEVKQPEFMSSLSRPSCIRALPSRTSPEVCYLSFKFKFQLSTSNTRRTLRDLAGSTIAYNRTIRARTETDRNGVEFERELERLHVIPRGPFRGKFLSQGGSGTRSATALAFHSPALFESAEIYQVLCRATVLTDVAFSHTSAPGSMVRPIKRPAISVVPIPSQMPRGRDIRCFFFRVTQSSLASPEFSSAAYQTVLGEMPDSTNQDIWACVASSRNPFFCPRLMVVTSEPTDIVRILDPIRWFGTLSNLNQFRHPEFNMEEAFPYPRLHPELELSTEQTSRRAVKACPIGGDKSEGGASFPFHRGSARQRQSTESVQHPPALELLCSNAAHTFQAELAIARKIYEDVGDSDPGGLRFRLPLSPAGGHPSSRAPQRHVSCLLSADSVMVSTKSHNLNVACSGGISQLLGAADPGKNGLLQFPIHFSCKQRVRHDTLLSMVRCFMRRDTVCRRLGAAGSPED
ncbi:hypothetical protein FB451DRAFT_1433022 [Mycena latifolia]|nr:hypothetical protein FB451DRAFT_1433022 [Mycena latifolia]